ncbi:hypothetical protein NIES2100_05040 [Calothrix sp. NIES-2100]|uniref:hypothetical protein n=1 Tax=Calothrix sp. NIES-2100 TaxID=1954172 RepID=UPI000B5DBAE8|nr:hypothetical protein NIES2100_05040 [Calothrix sp. NIES-2100]
MTKNVIDTIRNQVKDSGFNATSQQIRDKAFLLNINLETATTEQKQMISQAIVTDQGTVKDKEQSALSIPGKNQIQISESEKHQLIQKHSEKLQITLTSQEVTEVSQNISNNFKSRQSLASQVIGAIKKYVEYQANLEAQAIAETASEIIEIQNRTDSLAVQKLQEISEAVQHNQRQWQQAADDILELFKV